MLAAFLPLSALLFTISSHLPSALAAEWQLKWEDNFDGESLNTEFWNVANNKTHGDKELRLYLAEQVSVSNGCLVLRRAPRCAIR